MQRSAAQIQDSWRTNATLLPGSNGKASFQVTCLATSSTVREQGGQLHVNPSSEDGNLLGSNLNVPGSHIAQVVADV